RPSFRIGTIGQIDEAVIRGALTAIRAIWPGPRPCPGPDVLLHYESPSSQDNHSEKGFAEGARISHCLDSL
ncbi:MAG: hypothetical protein K2X54_27465, partial [Methylobacterium organophilum]|nr:hypothetical protein [Methylobacterium organophilum]